MTAATRVAIRRFIRLHREWTPEQIFGYVIDHSCKSGPFHEDTTLQEVKDLYYSMTEHEKERLL